MIFIVPVGELCTLTFYCRGQRDYCSTAIDICILTEAIVDAFPFIMPGDAVIDVQVGAVVAKSKSCTWSCGKIVAEGDE